MLKKAAAVFLLLLPALTPAGAAPLSVGRIVQATFLTGWKTKSGSYMAALDLHLADHWKTYWRAPGDAGIPPSFDWAGSANLASVAFHWPRPRLFELNGERTVGYMGELVLPIEFVPKAAGQPVAVKATVQIGVCNDICVPVKLHFSADLSGPGAANPAIRAALAEAPVSGKGAGLKGFSCKVRPIKGGLHLTARIGLPRLGPQETALFETADPTIWIGATSTKREGGELIAGADLLPAADQPFVLNLSGVTITILGRDRAVELHGCPAG